MTDHLTPSPFPMPKGRAYTDEEKREAIESLLSAWIKCKDLRLGQLLTNASHDGFKYRNLFYVEDALLVDLVNEYADKVKP